MQLGIGVRMLRRQLVEDGTDGRRWNQESGFGCRASSTIRHNAQCSGPFVQGPGPDPDPDSCDVCDSCMLRSCSWSAATRPGTTAKGSAMRATTGALTV